MGGQGEAVADGQRRGAGARLRGRVALAARGTARRLDRTRWARHIRVLRVLWRVTRAFLPLWPWVLILGFSTVAGISAELLEPWLHQVFVNRVLLGRQVAVLPDILALYALAALVQWLAGTAVHWSFVQATERFSVRLRVHAYHHLRRLSLRGLRRLSTGEVTAALQQFGPDVGEGYLGLLQALLASLYRLPASLALMAQLNGPLLRWTLPILAIYPLYPLVTAGPLRRALSSLSLFDVYSQGVVNDRVAGLRALLHRLDAEGDSQALYALLWRRLRLRLRAFFVDRAGGLIDIAVHQGLTVCLLGLGGLAVLHGQMTVGGLLAFLEYVRGVEGPVRRLLHLPLGAQRVAVVAERVFQVVDAPPDVRRPRHGRPVRLQGAIQFRGVEVRGDDGGPILSGIDLGIPAGSFCAIVGGSGAGKSTLASLVARLMDPDAGCVLLDGVDAREYDLAALRAAVAVVPQDPVFFRESVLANVRLARPEASAAEVAAALRRARAEERLDGPRGEGRTLREAGGNLSGGQLQRLALARMYLQDPTIVVLDEVTSALDPRLGRAVLDEILAWRGRRTVLLITHQPDLAARADLVAVLAAGRLQASGPPMRALSAYGRPAR